VTCQWPRGTETQLPRQTAAETTLSGDELRI
jgi:hypothetical protein